MSRLALNALKRVCGRLSLWRVSVLCLPRIDEGDATACKAVGITRHHGSTSDQGGSRDQCIERMDRCPGLTAADDDVGIAVGCRGIEGKHATAQILSNIAAAASLDRKSVV